MEGQVWAGGENSPVVIPRGLKAFSRSAPLGIQKGTRFLCPVYHQPELQRLFCPCHDSVYDTEMGDPVAGPPQRRLPRLLLRQEGDSLLALGMSEAGAP